MFGKSNIGPDGKPTITNPEDNRPKQMGRLEVILVLNFFNCWKAV